MDENCQKICRVINIDAQREVYTKLYDFVKKEIVDALKKNDIFKELYCDLKLCGSYADNLKISAPNEFDLVIQFKLPHLYEVNIQADNKFKGNVLINITEVLQRLKDNKKENMYAFLKERTNADGYLLQDRFQSWLEGCVTKYLSSINNELNFCGRKLNLKYSKQGPAHTIYVSCEQYKFSIDFVPGFKFTNSTSISARKVPSEKETYWEAIPRPIKKIQNNPSFRTSYTKWERDMFIQKTQFKNILRMMKKFRDKENLTHLRSYYIKTLFLWQLDKEKDDFWGKPSMELVHIMFQRLERALTRGEIPFFWDKELNLLGNLIPRQKLNMVSQVRLARRRIMCGGNAFLKVFLTDEELCQVLLKHTKLNEQPRKIDEQATKEIEQPAKMHKDELTKESPEFSNCLKKLEDCEKDRCAVCEPGNNDNDMVECPKCKMHYMCTGVGDVVANIARLRCVNCTEANLNAKHQSPAGASAKVEKTKAVPIPRVIPRKPAAELTKSVPAPEVNPYEDVNGAASASTIPPVVSRKPAAELTKSVPAPEVNPNEDVNGAASASTIPRVIPRKPAAELTKSVAVPEVNPDEGVNGAASASTIPAVTPRKPAAELTKSVAVPEVNPDEGVSGAASASTIPLLDLRRPAAVNGAAPASTIPLLDLRRLAWELAKPIPAPRVIPNEDVNGAAPASTIPEVIFCGSAAELTNSVTELTKSVRELSLSAQKWCNSKILN